MGKFKPLALGLIDEGRFVKDIDDAVTKAAEQLLAHKTLYGPERAMGAKATVSVAVTLKFEGRDENDFSIKGQISTKIPSKPACVTVAIADKDDAEKDTLFVRASGSTKDSPAQGVLATLDGQTVDTATGEVLTVKKTKVK